MVKSISYTCCRSFVLLVFIPIIVLAETQSGSVSGVVKLVTESGDIDEQSRSIVVFEPKDKALLGKNAPKLHIVEMKGKRYLPRYLAVRVGDSVSYLNLDNFGHNVFSASGQNEFDLGSYPFRGKRIRRFQNAGLVKVYCNIHSSMANFVMVHRGWATITSDSGSFNLSGLPAGEYHLTAWNIHGEVRTEQQISAGVNPAIALRIKESVKTDLSHLNKFGEEYPEDDGDEIY